MFKKHLDKLLPYIGRYKVMAKMIMLSSGGRTCTRQREKTYLTLGRNSNFIEIRNGWVRQHFAQTFIDVECHVHRCTLRQSLPYPIGEVSIKFSQMLLIQLACSHEFPYPATTTKVSCDAHASSTNGEPTRNPVRSFLSHLFHGVLTSKP